MKKIRKKFSKKLSKEISFYSLLTRLTSMALVIALVISLVTSLVSCSAIALLTGNTPTDNTDDNDSNEPPPPPIVLNGSIVYKPFHPEHREKFSLGDFDSPYLVELIGDYQNLAEPLAEPLNSSSFTVAGTTYSVTKTNESDRVFLGLGNFAYSDFVNLDLSSPSNFILNLTIASGSRTTNLSLDLNGATTATAIRETANNEIYTWRDLQNIRHNLAGSYQQMNDITFPEAGQDGFPEDGFTPLGDDSNAFTGSYDGKGHRINNFFINRPTLNHVGLFGTVNSFGSSIKDLVLDVDSVTGRDGVGSLVGNLVSGVLTNTGAVSSSDGTIMANGIVGGLVGYNRVGNIFGYAEVNVVIRERDSSPSVPTAGGLVGVMFSSDEDNPGKAVGYATGDVTVDVSGVRLGGLVGFLNDKHSIIIGYSTGRVLLLAPTDTTSIFGGFLGSHFRLNTNVQGYWDEASSGQTFSAHGGDARFFPAGVAGISSIENVFFTNNIYEDRRPGATNQVFNNPTFLNHFDLPGRSGTWPTLK